MHGPFVFRVVIWIVRISAMRLASDSCHPGHCMQNTQLIKIVIALREYVGDNPFSQMKRHD
jgi:hypothetical protein